MCELKTVTEYDVCHSHSKNALANDWQLLQGIGSGPGRSSGHSPGKKPVSEPFNPTASGGPPCVLECVGKGTVRKAQARSGP